MDSARRRAVQRVAARQEGAIGRSQVLDAGGSATWIASPVSTRRWQRLWPGVYATTTGRPGFMTRAYGALLYAGPGAGLGPESSAFLHGMSSRPPGTLDVLIPGDRRVVSQPGLRIRRASLDGRRSSATPTRLPPAATAVALVEAARGPQDVVAVLCAAARAGCPPADVRAEVALRGRLRRRTLVRDLLAEVQAGVESPLEHRYQHDVERRHGLPAATLQHRQVLAARPSRWPGHCAPEGGPGRHAGADRPAP